MHIQYIIHNNLYYVELRKQTEHAALHKVRLLIIIKRMPHQTYATVHLSFRFVLMPIKTYS